MLMYVINVKVNTLEVSEWKQTHQNHQTIHILSGKAIHILSGKGFSPSLRHNDKMCVMRGPWASLRERAFLRRARKKWRVHHLCIFLIHIWHFSESVRRLSINPETRSTYG